MIRSFTSLVICAVLAMPAAAQEAPPSPPDEEATEAASTPQPQIERPYEAAPTEVGPLYDARVQGRIGAAQSQRGRLDGGWILSDEAGAPLYALQFSHAPENGLEGAWRDLRRSGAHTLGVIGELAEAGGQLTATLPGQDSASSVRLTLRSTADGWAGEMREGGASRSVVARRDRISAAWDSFTPAASTRPFIAASAAPKATPAKKPVAKRTVKRKAPARRKRR